MSKTWMEDALKLWREKRPPEALSELLKAQRDRAYATALHITRSSSDAEDVVQEAFVKMLSRTAGFENVEAFEAAVYRAVVQCALDALRKRARRIEHEGAVGKKEEATMERAEEMAGSTLLTDRESVRTLLRGAVEELPHEERVPVVLCYYQGLTVAQTARTLEIPRGTLRKRLARALDRLRRCLKQNDRRASSAVILALLWQDGAVPAPGRLCAALDRVLPGRPCAEISALPLPGPAAAPAWSSACVEWSLSHLGASAAAGLLAAAMGAGIYSLTNEKPARPEVSVAPDQMETARAKEGHALAQNLTSSDSAAARGGSRGDLPGPDPVSVIAGKKEEESMKSKLGAWVLLGGMLLPCAVQAEEPNPEAAKVIAQIEARRAEKAAAEAKVVAIYSNREANEARPGSSKR